MKKNYHNQDSKAAILKGYYVTISIIGKFKQNTTGFWKDYRWFIILFVFALLCDSISTIHFMLIDGTEAEAHPLIQFISTHIAGAVIGPIIAFLLKLLAGILVAIYCRRFAAYIFIAASIISMWAAWYNIWGYQIYTPFFIKWIPW